MNTLYKSTFAVALLFLGGCAHHAGYYSGYYGGTGYGGGFSSYSGYRSSYPVYYDRPGHIHNTIVNRRSYPGGHGHNDYRGDRYRHHQDVPRQHGRAPGHHTEDRHYEHRHYAGRAVPNQRLFDRRSQSRGFEDRGFRSRDDGNRNRGNRREAGRDRDNHFFRNR